MNTSSTAGKVSLKPLEGMKIPVQKRVDTIETEGLDRIGFFDEGQKSVCFDATTGSIDFNPEINFDTKVPDGVKSSLFNPGEWASIIPSSVNAVAKTADVARTVVSEAKNAASSLLTEEIFFNAQNETPQNEDPSKLDPAIAKKQEQQDVVRARENANNVIENATRQASQQEYEEMIKMALRLGVNVENLADKLDAPHLRKADLLKTYYLALGDSLQIAEQKAAERTRGSVLSSPAKQGGQGQNLSNEDNKSGETHQTAQTATG